MWEIPVRIPVKRYEKYGISTLRYGLYATYASSLDDPDVQAGAPVVLAQIRELLSVVLAQIRELLAEDTEACPYPNITDVYATAAAAPLAAN